MASNYTIQELSKQLKDLQQDPWFDRAEQTALTFAKIFGISESVFKAFRSNKQGEKTMRWFHPKPGHWDDLPCTLELRNHNLPVDIRLFRVKKMSKQVVAGITNLTHNFEDSPEVFDDENIGIDIIVPHQADRIIIVLSSRWVLRTLELYGKLTATHEEILHQRLQPFDRSNKKLTHNILRESFNIKSLNKKFYQGIARFFVLLAQHLEWIHYTTQQAKYFANRLIGRIVFCRFLRRKNIIASDYDYFTIIESNATEYYHQVLQKLFFATLNTPTENRREIVRKLWVDKQTPYLNGWLFEAKEIDKDSKLTLPTHYFSELYEFLDGYHFTTDESTSSYQQVAVDPEMLGRIFENLLAEQTTETGEQARKASGAFYTPREIVDYMCRESLKAHIGNKLKSYNIAESDCEKAIKQLFEVSDSDYSLHSKNEEYDIIQTKHRGKLIEILDTLTILDPACGSGAFPMGMMQMIFHCYERILPETKFDPWETKKKIIENTLFWVDIEPMAVEISRLRAWLAIIVDESENKKVEPLPNLEFKFVCANSLIQLDKSRYQSTGLDQDPDLKHKLSELKHKFFRARSPESKETIKKEYKNLLTQGMFETQQSLLLKTFDAFDTSKSAWFFDPEYMFGEEVKDGFDIVIGNPPYIEVSTKEQKDFYKINYSDALSGHYDLYIFFFVMWIKLLKLNWVISYITPHSFLWYSQFFNLRKVIFNETIPLEITNRIEWVFESVIVDSAISILVKNKNKTWTKTKFSHKTIDWWLMRNLASVDIDLSEVWYETYDVNAINNSRILRKHSNWCKNLWDITWSSQWITVYASVQWEKINYFRDFIQDTSTKKYLKWKNIHKYYFERDKQYIKYWSHLRCKRNEKYFESPKIFLRQTSDKVIACYIEEPFYAIDSVHSLIQKEWEVALKYILWVINSRFWDYLYKLIISEEGKVFAQVKLTFLRKIPIKIPTLNQESAIITLVNQILSAKKLDPKADTGFLEKQIDKLVYELYELTDEEVKIVEGERK